MPNTSPQSPLNATIINIHSPSEDVVGSSRRGSDRRPSNSTSQHHVIKLSPKAEEYQKMIHHIVGKLYRRKRPPSSLACLSDLCQGKKTLDQFDNEDTTDLLIQLRSALLVCHQAGLSTPVLLGERTPAASPVSSRGNSPAPSPRFGSPSQAVDSFHTMLSRTDRRTTEFELVLTVLNDIIMNDSRFKTTNPRPSRPPYTMQSVLIDIGTVLIQICQDSSDLYHIGTEFLPAFEAFSRDEMLGKLLAMYLDNLLPKLINLKDSSTARAKDRTDRQDEPNITGIGVSKSKFEHNTPTINIHNSDPEPTKSTSSKTTHLTIDTRPNIVNAPSPLSPYSPGGHSNVSSLLHVRLENHHAYALYTPLLLFIIEHLDPYLALHSANNDNVNHSFSSQTNCIHSLRRAISYMAVAKPDLYLDVLDIIARGTSDVRVRACQILFHHYSISLGHGMITNIAPFLSTQDEIALLDRYYQEQEFEDQQQHQTKYSNHLAHFYRHHLHPSNSYHPPPTQFKGQFTNDSCSGKENMQEDQHIWYPHMFDQPDNNGHSPIEAFESNHVNNFNLNSDPTIAYNNMNEPFCKECFKQVIGFGFRCYQCNANLHYHCYNNTVLTDLNDQNIMFYIKAGGIQKVITPLFSKIPMPPRLSTISKEITDVEVALFGHIFQLVNISTLLLCACCSLPLWGICHQAYRCSECNRFVHPHCLAYAKRKGWFEKFNNFQTCVPFQPLMESDIQISTDALSKSLIKFYGDDILPLNKGVLETKNGDEVGLLLNVFKVQESIINYGVAAGSVSIVNASKDPLNSSVPVHQQQQPSDDNTLADQQSKNFSFCPLLTKAIKLCQDLLKSGRCPRSTISKSFFSEKRSPSSIADNFYFLNQEEYFSHLTTLMKSLTNPSSNNDNNSNNSVYPQTSIGTSFRTDKAASAGDSRGFLQVTTNHFGGGGGGSTSGGNSFWDSDDDNDDQVPNESLERSMLSSWVMTVLGFKSKKATEILLQHMRNLGTFERFDGSPVLFPNVEESDRNNSTTAAAEENTESVLCIFPVPYAVDCSPFGEVLITAIDACLQDIDLSMNECGLLLLVRRCSPSAYMSAYLRERLMHTIVSWIFNEDTQLLMLHAEYTSTMKNEHGMSPHGKVNYYKSAQQPVYSRMRGGVQGAAGIDRFKKSNLQHAAGVSNSSSSLYVTMRAALRDRYIVRWMAAIYRMDKHMYSETIFKIIENILDDEQEMENGFFNEQNSTGNSKQHIIEKYDRLIGLIFKLKTNGLLFASLDSILQKWFDASYEAFRKVNLLKEKTPVDIRHLAKFCASKNSLQKTSSSSPSSTEVSNPIDIIMVQFEKTDLVSVARGIRWLSLLTHSGTGIPSKHFAHIARLIVAARSPLDIMAEFVQIMWFQVVNIKSIITPRNTVMDVIGYLNEMAADNMRSNNENQNLSDESLHIAQTFVKYSVALACYAFGCPLKHVFEIGIVPAVSSYTSNNPQSKRHTQHLENPSLIQIEESMPLFQCLLAYLQFDQINVREDIIKMFYALLQWGTVSNKDDFLNRCMKHLIATVWELLTPTYDYMSEFTLTLLMNLITIDVSFFHACVFKIFEDSNWEVRFQGLDNLFGLFTKMDAAFQTEWLGQLAHLGPVFSYFVSCLWDKEEYVRSKAYAMIRAFGTLHLRSAFRCWEAYFLTATERQKMPLVSLMIRLNALFPDWQVLQWDSVLEALEYEEHPFNTLEDDLTSHPTTAISAADYFTKNPANPFLDDSTEDEVEESEGQQKREGEQGSDKAEADNVKVLLLTLALQMLSSHLSIEVSQITRLKFALVRHMGFEDCHIYTDEQDTAIDFGPLRYDPNDPTQAAIMIACSRGLKKIMDSFAPLPAETVASMATDYLDQDRVNFAENTSPGVHFIDVVLKMVSSGIELKSLGHLTLKTWLEIVLIVVYKHDILEREYEQNIVSCIKEIIGLLTEDISEESKLLILEILKCLLRRSDHLTAMVLSKQILTLGKLMTKLGVRTTEPVYLKAKEFLKSAFLRFAIAGLFVLMFKNQTVSDTAKNDVDLFFVLRTVIDPDDIIPDEDVQGEVIYLRDQPLRDVFDKLMKQQMDRKAFSTVLHNTSRYVELVHSHPYADSILTNYASFLNMLVKHTSDWRRADWNINPVLTMSAILLKEHPYHYSILLPPIQTLFKHGLLNCNVEHGAVVHMITAYSAIISIPGVQPNNIFIDMVADELKNTLSTSTRLNKDTFLMLLELVLWDISPDGSKWNTETEATILGESAYKHQHTSYFENKLLHLLPSLVAFNKRASSSKQFTKKDFKSSRCVSRLITSMCIKDPKLMVIIFGYLKLENSTECLRFLNWFILTILKEGADQLLFDVLNYEAVMVQLLVRTIKSIDIDFHSPDIGFSYSSTSEKLLLWFLLIKAYALLKLRATNFPSRDGNRGHQNLNTDTFWTSLWPAMQQLLGSIEVSTLFMTANVGLSVWNMMLSLLQFLFASRSDVVMIYAYEWSELLINLDKGLAFNTTDIRQNIDGIDHDISLNVLRKQVKRLLEMFTVPPVEVPIATMVNQLLLELRDVMRLQAENNSSGNNEHLYAEAS